MLRPVRLLILVLLFAMKRLNRSIQTSLVVLIGLRQSVVRILYFFSLRLDLFFQFILTLILRLLPLSFVRRPLFRRLAQACPA